METFIVAANNSFDFYLACNIQGVPKNGFLLTWHNSSEMKVGVFWKIQLKFCRIGNKPLKISGEKAKKNKLGVSNPPLKMELI